MCIDYLKKVGGLCFYNSSKSTDSFIRENFVYWCWLYVFSVPTGMALMSINVLLVLPLFGVNFDWWDRGTGCVCIILHIISSAIFYYFVFLYKKKYLKYMDLYKNYPKTKALYFVLFLVLALLLPGFHFTLFR